VTSAFDSSVVAKVILVSRLPSNRSDEISEAEAQRFTVGITLSVKGAFDPTARDRVFPNRGLSTRARAFNERGAAHPLRRGALPAPLRAPECGEGAV
jgi:hypothetical protein